MVAILSYPFPSSGSYRGHFQASDARGEGCYDVVLVGLGRWGQVLWKNLLAHPRYRVRALVTSQENVVAPPDVRILRHYREINAGLASGLIVATPPDTHRDIVLHGLAHEMAVLVEKPLTLNLADAQAIQEASERWRGAVLVNHTHLWSRAFRALAHNLDRIGPVRRIRAEAGNRGPVRSYSSLVDYGSHDIAMVLSLLGRHPLHASVKETARLEDGAGLAANYVVQMTYPGGVEVDLKVGSLFDVKRRWLAVTGQRGELVYDDLNDNKLSLNGQPIPLPDSKSPVVCVLDEFAQLLARPQPRDSQNDLRLGVDVVRILDDLMATLPPPLA